MIYNTYFNIDLIDYYLAIQFLEFLGFKDRLFTTKWFVFI